MDFSIKDNIKFYITKIKFFFKYRIPFTSGWNMYFNPYFPWWKARKYFKKPKWKIKIFGKMSWFYGLPGYIKYYNRILDIRISALGYKDKYNEPRHEWNPYISIVLFRKYQIVWELAYYNKEYIKNIATWEAIADYVYYNIKDINQLIERHTWNDITNNNCITIKDNLKI